jgi:hypothetical protein
LAAEVEPPAHLTALKHVFTVRLGGIDHPKIERRLITVTNGAIFIASVALSPSVSEPLNATLRMKMAWVVAEIKRRSIFALVVNWKF